MERGIFETVGRRYVPNVNYRQQDFRDFIVAYPKGKSPFSAAIAWEQAQPTDEDVAMIMEVIGRYSGQTFTDEELVMIPAPEVFLNQTRWRDDEPFPGLVMCRRDARRADEEARRLRQAKDEVAPPPGKQFDLEATARKATSPDAAPADPAAYGIVRQHDGNITPPKLKLQAPPANAAEASAVAASSEA